MKRRTQKITPGKSPPLEGRKRLLADERVRDWYDDKATKSRLSAITNVRKLDFILEQLGLSLDEVEHLARARPDELRRLLNRYVQRAKSAGRLDSYLAKLFVGLRAYFKFRRIDFDLFPELDSIQGASIATERVPSQEQLGVVLDRLSLRGKVVSLLMAHSGVRPQVIGAYEGARGLVLSDLPDLVLDTEIRFEQLPFTILGRAELAKRRRSWTTFGSRQLATAIVAYLQERRARGEKLEQGSPLVAHKELRGAALRSREGSGTKFMTTTHVVLEVANVLHAAAPSGTRWRPYVLRGYFSTALLRAGMDRDLREALMSHGGDKVASAYNVGKPWNPELMREAREAYRRAEPFLLTSGLPAERATDRVLRALFRARGATNEEIDSLANKSPEEIEAWVKKRGLAAAPEKRSERAVSVSDVPRLLEDGWEFVAPLNGSMAVLRSPATHGNVSAVLPDL